VTTEAALLAAIAANLDDDAPRLVYADWLAERGDPRGELMQLQVSLSTMLEEDERRKPTEKRVKEILEENGAKWLGRLVELRRHGIEYGFERGVIGTVSGPGAVLAKHAAKILEAAPLLTRVQVVAVDKDVTGLVGSPLAARIRSLRIGSGSGRIAGLAELALPELRVLDLDGIAIGPEDLALLDAPHLQAVRIAMCRLNKGVVEAFARVRGPLRRLELPSAHFGPRFGQIAGASASYQGLQSLALAGNDLGRAGLDALLPALANVEYLDLRGNELAVTDLPKLLDPAALPKVRALLLGGNALGDAGVTAIVSSSLAQQLVRLHLGEAGVTPLGGRALAAAASLSNLKALTLTGKRFDPETEAMLLASPFLANARIYCGDRFLARSKKPPPKRPARKA